MVVFQDAKADFGALEILEDGDGTALFLGGGANPFDLLVAFFVGAVRTVKTAAVDAGHDYLFD